MSYQILRVLINLLLVAEFFLVHSAMAQQAHSSSTVASAASLQNSVSISSPASAISSNTSSLATPVTLGIAVPAPPNLEKPLADLAIALTKLVEKKSEPEKLTTTMFELLGKLGALIATLVAGYGSYKASKNIPWFKENREFVGMVVAAVSLVVLFYLLSGVVTSVLYVLIAILVLLVALVVATAHLLSFIDTRYPDVRDSILSSFSDSTVQKPLRKLARDNARNMYDWLSNIAFAQSIAGELELRLRGAFVEDFDETIFRLTPSERLSSSWQIVDDRLLIPVGMSLTLRRDDGSAEALVVNIQLGFVVLRVGDTLQVKKFSQEGFQTLGSAFMAHQINKMQETMEQQQVFANNVSLFKEQLQ